MRKIEDIIEYNDIINNYSAKDSISNNYILEQEASDLIIHDLLYVDYYKKNVFLYVKKDVGMRVYYYINDINEKADFNEYKDLFVEILFRGEEPTTEIDYLCGCGFLKNLVRDQYSGMYKDLSLTEYVPGVTIEPAQTLLTVKQACELFNRSFDKLSGDFILEKDYQKLLDTKSILVAWDTTKSHFLGALHQVKEGVVNIIGHVAVMDYARGNGIGKALVNAFIKYNRETDKTRYQLWVQRQNTPAVEMYKKTGFKSTNKSTISLIKQ